MAEYFEIQLSDRDRARIAREREKARALKKTHWWQQRLAEGKCHYCGNAFDRSELTLDHVVPLARGGGSTKGNCVPACKACNASKRLSTPVEDIFQQLERERLK